MKRYFIAVIGLVIILCAGCSQTPTAPVVNDQVVHSYPKLKLNDIETYQFSKPGALPTFTVVNNNANRLYVKSMRSAGYSEGGEQWLVIWEGWVDGHSSYTGTACFSKGDQINNWYQIDQTFVKDDYFFLGSSDSYSSEGHSSQSTNQEEINGVVIPIPVPVPE